MFNLSRSRILMTLATAFNNIIPRRPKFKKSFNMPDPFVGKMHGHGGDTRASRYAGTCQHAPEKSDWYKELSPKQRLCHQLRVGMTNWQRTQWNRVGSPGSEDPGILEMFAVLDRGRALPTIPDLA